MRLQAVVTRKSIKTQLSPGSASTSPAFAFLASSFATAIIRKQTRDSFVNYVS